MYNVQKIKTNVQRKFLAGPMAEGEKDALQHNKRTWDCDD